MNKPKKIQEYITKTFNSEIGIDLTFLPQYDNRDPDFGQYRLNKFKL